VTGEQAAFGSRLRRERERRNIRLSDVAANTKIAKSLLASLERGDASNWPPGIYRRSFFREYASSIGLPSDPMMADFLRLFPERSDSATELIDAPETGDGLRLTLAEERHPPFELMATQAGAALLDVGLVITIGAALGDLLHLFSWTAVGMFAVAYYSLATLSLGGSPMLWLITAALRQEERGKAARPQRLNSRDVLRMVTRQREAPGPELDQFASGE
jgi:transcriptional regulator with XRE-family HTH domain